MRIHGFDNHSKLEYDLTAPPTPLLPPKNNFPFQMFELEIKLRSLKVVWTG